VAVVALPFLVFFFMLEVTVFLVVVAVLATVMMVEQVVQDL
jgi:hypothetical protein